MRGFARCFGLMGFLRKGFYTQTEESTALGGLWTVETSAGIVGASAGTMICLEWNS